MGRLHTRYSPVRRSPATYCYVPLPPDLHVLSLPLAFILSQDQTLRCTFSYFYIFRRAAPAPLAYKFRSFKESSFPFLRLRRDLRPAWCVLPHNFKELPPYKDPPAKKDGPQTYGLFSFPQNFAAFFFRDRPPAALSPSNLSRGAPAYPFNNPSINLRL